MTRPSHPGRRSPHLPYLLRLRGTTKESQERLLQADLAAAAEQRAERQDG